jgi:hypothetical protein
MKTKSAFLIGFLLIAGLAKPAVAAPRDVHLNAAQLRAVALAAVRAAEPNALRQPGFGIDREGDRDGYAWFEATAYSQGSVHQGFVVVDPWTGDAWDGVSECGEITSARLRRLQGALRKQIGLTPHAYATHRRRGPMCDQPTAR